MQNTDYTKDPDVQLMLKFQNGDKAAFEQLMVKYYPRVLNFLYRYLGQREVCEDITQEVFVRVYKSAHRYSPQSKLQTWIFTIAKRLALNELRKNKRKMVSIHEKFEGEENSYERQLVDSKGVTPAQGLLIKEKNAIIKAAIESLPVNQRMAVILRRFENMSYEEIAQTMNTSEKAVKSLLNRAKESLKDKLSKYFI